MRIDRGARRWIRDAAFADNGFARNKENRIMDIKPWGDVVYAAHQGKVIGDPVCTVEARSKETGEIVREIDVTEYFTLIKVQNGKPTGGIPSGPMYLGVNSYGIWMTSWSGGTPIVFSDQPGERQVDQPPGRPVRRPPFDGRGRGHGLAGIGRCQSAD